MTRLEDRLRDAMAVGSARVAPAPDLFARVHDSIVADRHRRTTHRKLVASATVAATVSITTIAISTIADKGVTHMAWWIFEVIAAALLAAIAVTLGPFIKRFGRSYAADVFRSNPSTGKSFIVLTDFAYYLIFGAYILFTTKVERPRAWPRDVGAEQVQQGIIRLGGILLIIGVLHGLNLVLLPIIGRLLTLNRRLDQQMRELAARDLSGTGLDQDDEGSGK